MLRQWRWWAGWGKCPHPCICGS